MVKKLLVCVACAFLIISGMEMSAIYGSQHFGDFVRLYPPHTLQYPKNIRLGKENFYIAGCTSHFIYLGSYSFPFHLLRIDFSLKDSVSINIPIPPNNHLHGRFIKLQLDSPYIYLVDELNTSILFCRISDPANILYLSTKVNAASIECKAISPSSFIIRNIDSTVGSAVLSKLSLNSSSIMVSKNILRKQIDGIFDTDGMLHYDHSLNQLVYVYFYRNQYIGIDTSLQVKYRGKTLDSNSQAKISVGYIQSEDKTTMSTPPFSVNKLSDADRGLLYIQSALVAKNDTGRELHDNSAIDVYGLKRQTYQFSFYLPLTGGENMKDFRVSQGRLVALHGPYLEVFEINHKYLIED